MGSIAKLRGVFPPVEIALDAGQRACVGIDREHCDAVISAIRSIKKFTGGIDFDFRRRVVAAKAFWECGDSLQFM